jgi:hypothetical protein
VSIFPSAASACNCLDRLTKKSTNVANVVLMRGSEGEPTSSLNRLPEMHFLEQSSKTFSSQEHRFDDTPIHLPTQLNVQSHSDFLRQIEPLEHLPVAAIWQQAQILNRYCQ